VSQVPERALPPSAAALVMLAWKSTFAALLRMPGMFLGLVVLSLLISLGGEWLLAQFLFGRELPKWVTAWPLLTWVGLIVVRVALESIVVALAAVAISRFILLGQTSALRSVRDGRVWRFAAWLIAFQLVVWMLLLVPLRPGLALIKFVIFAAAAIMAVRSVLIFPAIAVDDPAKGRIATSWSQTQDQFWRIVLVFGGTLLPVFLLQFTVGLGVLVGWFAQGSLSSLLSVALQVPAAVLEVVGMALGAAVASWVYMWVMENPRPVETAPKVA